MRWAAIADLERAAASQHGLFTAAEAQELGLTAWALRQANKRGWVRMVRRGVYAFAGRRPSGWEPILAASLAAGPDAVISHGAAAAIHGFWGLAGAGPELTLPGGAGRRMTGVRIHRSIGFGPDDIVERRRVKVTSPERTLIDVAPRINDHLLPRIIDEGAISRLWTAERILDRLDAFASPRRGTRRLRLLLADRMQEECPDSPLEQSVLRVIKLWLPPFNVHHRIEVAGRIVEVDVAWPELLIAVEIDGYDVRAASRTKFDSDRFRSNLLEAYGWRVVHLTSAMDDATILAQLVPMFPPELITGRLRTALAAGPNRGDRHR